MIFRIYDSDFGIKYNGVNYDFDHVNELTIENPQNTKLTRGANSSNTTGLVYREGTKEPNRWTVTIMAMSQALKELLDSAYNKSDRLDVYCISKIDGSSKMAKNAILSQAPQQLNISEGPDSMNVQLMFETFDSSEVHKS